MLPWRMPVAQCLLLKLCLIQGAVALRVQTADDIERPKVDVLYSGDRHVLIGIRTAITSTLSSAKEQARLRMHVAVEQKDAGLFRRSLGFASGENTRSLPGGASLSLHFLDVEELQPLYAVDALREDSPSNYARYYADKYLPEEADRCVWLDADVIVQHDVAELADALANDSTKTWAVARYPGESWGFNGSRTIEAEFTNRTWAVANMSERVLKHPLWNIGVLAFNMRLFRSHELRDRAIKWIKLNQELHVYPGGSQMPWDLAALIHSGTQEPSLEVDAEWNCWWGFTGNIRTDQELDRCKIVHFAGENKPWNAGESVPGYWRWSNTDDQAQQLFHVDNVTSA